MTRHLPAITAMALVAVFPAWGLVHMAEAAKVPFSDPWVFGVSVWCVIMGLYALKLWSERSGG